LLRVVVVFEFSAAKVVVAGCLFDATPRRWRLSVVVETNELRNTRARSAKTIAIDLLLMHTKKVINFATQKISLQSDAFRLLLE
jgi:hypothetical protein